MSWGPFAFVRSQTYVRWMRACPKCGRTFEPNRPQQRFCRRNCGRWKDHDLIERRLAWRPPAEHREAYLAGLIATDGYVERRRGRSAPTGISIKMASAARPLLDQIAEHYGRRLCARSNGQYVLTFVDLPVCWKTALPALSPELVPHYVRGLLDGDGCISGARVANDVYPYIALTFNPTRERWVGEFYKRFLREHAIRYREQKQLPTVRQVRSWSAQAHRVCKLVYAGNGWSHPMKLERAQQVIAAGPAGIIRDGAFRVRLIGTGGGNLVSRHRRSG
jgi:Homing endonuclease